ncbi:MAG: hypothetical protein HYU78_05200 [Rhodocyclales bacterium]|nr:hypothetical protein [Rhodocyclales bacterium]
MGKVFMIRGGLNPCPFASSSLPAALLLALLAGCAAAPPAPPRIDRLPAEPAAGMPSARALSLDEIVAMVRAGAPPEAVVRRWREDGARLKPGAASLLELHARGVPPAVLDALVEAREAALRTDLDSLHASRLARLEAELAAERARPRTCPAPAWSPYPIYPYGVWGRPGGWGGGAYWGW